jgi:hypothetical protein
MIDDELSALQSSLGATNVHDQASLVYDLQGAFGPSSKAGASKGYSPILQRYQVNSGRMIPTRDLYNHSSGPSPLGLLGAGRIDPFLSYPVENPNRILHELIDISKSQNPLCSQYSYRHCIANPASNAFTSRHKLTSHRCYLFPTGDGS